MTLCIIFIVRKNAQWCQFLHHGISTCQLVHNLENWPLFKNVKKMREVKNENWDEDMLRPQSILLTARCPRTEVYFSLMDVGAIMVCFAFPLLDRIVIKPDFLFVASDGLPLAAEDRTSSFYCRVLMMCRIFGMHKRQSRQSFWFLEWLPKPYHRGGPAKSPSRELMSQ